MNNLVGIVGGALPLGSLRNDDDSIDKLNYRGTVCLLVLFSVFVTTRQYVGEPIHCWGPAHFTYNWMQYTNSYCWIQDTYYLPFEEYIPRQDEPRDFIPYYQWVPLILLIQGLLFYLPIVFWRNRNARQAIDINGIIYASHPEKKESDEAVRLQKCAKMMDRCVDFPFNLFLLNRSLHCTFSNHCYYQISIAIFVMAIHF